MIGRGFGRGRSRIGCTGLDVHGWPGRESPQPGPYQRDPQYGDEDQPQPIDDPQDGPQ